MGEHRPRRSGDRLLKGAHVGFGDLWTSNGNEAVAKAGILRHTLFGRRAGLKSVFANGAVVDDGREAVGLELPERFWRWLPADRKLV